MENSKDQGGTIVRSVLSLNRRKLSELLIYPAFQGRLILLNTLTWVAAFLAMEIAAWRAVAHLRELGRSVGLPANHAYFKLIDLQAKELLIYAAAAFVLSVVVSTVISLFVSHQVAGPIVKLRSHFQDIAAGRTRGPLSFRNRDFFKDLPAVVNDALDRAQEKKRPEEGQETQKRCA